MWKELPVDVKDQFLITTVTLCKDSSNPNALRLHLDKESLLDVWGLVSKKGT